MKTLRLTENDAAAAGQILKNGGIVAIPTETVYGLAADAFNAEAVRRVFWAKGRPQDNPLIVHIADAAELARLVRTVPPEAAAAADAFWPGPLTMVLPKRAEVPANVTAGLDTVAVRLPGHAVARAVIRAAGSPLAAPSANRSGSPSPTDARHVLMDLDGRIDAVVDGGGSAVGLESTVVDFSGETPQILRPGGISADELARVCGSIRFDLAVHGTQTEGAAASPGLKYKHYAPEAEACFVSGAGSETAVYILQNARAGDAVLCFDSYARHFGHIHAVPYGEESEPETLAHHFYAALRTADAAHPARIFIQAPLLRPDDPAGLSAALYNRMVKAAGHRIMYPGGAESK